MIIWSDSNLLAPPCWLSLFQVTFVISVYVLIAFLMRTAEAVKRRMDNLIFCLIAQLNLMFGVAGLIWPDKLKPFFGVLMFPWPATYRLIRVNGIVAIGAYLLVVGKLIAVGH